LQRAEVVGISETGSKALENGPILMASFGPHFSLQILSKIRYHPIVIQKSVIDVEKEYRARHAF
jgi:hypothetical protein